MAQHSQIEAINMTDLPEHVRRNRAHWDQLAAQFVSAGEHRWTVNEPNWGIWSVPESEVHMFPQDLVGKDVIELGCGTAYVSCWLARRGARVVAIDNSEQQLATARRLQREHNLDFPLIHGNAESVPYPDASFDFAVSEYGACLWADPYRWVPEASRLLRPGGGLHFLVSAFLSTPSCSRSVYLPRTTLPRATDSCVRRSACIASSGQLMIAWNFTFPTAIGSDCCDDQDLRWRIFSKFGLEKTRKRPIRS